jgi:hypothetical protein
MAVERSAFVYWEEYGVDDMSALERWKPGCVFEADDCSAV